ncbi:MAG: hypothetical protein KatS3mg082_1741 [Nitrospiraceae bacterium]|nr:MAG: hypothetical protein KatS3mg082_1741 [Nitrospiraceae bacterium]
MQIKALTNFKHGVHQFVQGRLYDVPDQLGFYFVQCGWAQDPSGVVEPGSTAENATLQIRDVTSAVESQNMGG